MITRYEVTYYDAIARCELVRRFDTREGAQEFLDANALVFALRRASGARSTVEVVTFGPAPVIATGSPTINRAITGDDLLTALAAVAPPHRSTALAVCGVKILRQAADLCGVGDAETLTKRQAIAAIIENF